MREILVSDSKELAYLHCNSFDVGWSEQDFSQMLSTGDYFGFICDEGFIIGRKIIDEAEIFSIAVLPKFRARGIGSALIKNFHEKAKQMELKKIFLEVNANNTIAQRLYLSNGYEQISVRHNYYGNQDAVIMQFVIN